MIFHFFTVQFFCGHRHNVVYVALPLAFLKYETRFDFVRDGHFPDNRLARLVMSFANLLNSIHMTSCFDGYGIGF